MDHRINIRTKVNVKIKQQKRCSNSRRIWFAINTSYNQDFPIVWSQLALVIKDRLDIENIKQLKCALASLVVWLDRLNKKKKSHRQVNMSVSKQAQANPRFLGVNHLI